MQVDPNAPITAAEANHNKPEHTVQQIHKKAANLDALVESLDGYVWSVDTGDELYYFKHRFIHPH